jgi:hypothetical protein
MQAYAQFYAGLFFPFEFCVRDAFNLNYKSYVICTSKSILFLYFETCLFEYWPKKNVGSFTRLIMQFKRLIMQVNKFWILH